jgi:hypothetical protein
MQFAETSVLGHRPPSKISRGVKSHGPAEVPRYLPPRGPCQAAILEDATF